MKYILDNRHLPNGNPCLMENSFGVRCNRPPHAHRVFHKPQDEPCSKCGLPALSHITRRSLGSPTARSALLRRDGSVCRLCLHPFDPVPPPWPHPLSITIDHIIPIEQGGIHNPSNLQLAHNACNLKKRNDHPSAKQQPPAK